MLTQSKNVFKLSDKFLSSYVDAQPNWGPLGYVTYKRTYARILEGYENTTEEFWQTCKRVVEGVYNIQKAHCDKLRLPWNAHKSQKSAQEMFRRMWDFKFLPPGRGLWMMGTDYIWETGSAALNNCFDGDTEVFIKNNNNEVRLARLRDLEGKRVNLLVSNSGDSREAIINNFGTQTLYDITLKPRGMRSNYEIKYRATKDHRWILSNGESTTSLRKGDVLKSTACLIGHDYEENQDVDDWKRGFCHGLIFGDGTRHTYYPNRHFIRLCGEKEAQHISVLEEMSEFVSTTYPDSFNGDAVVTLVLDNENWKSLPEDKNVVYMQGFLDGWIAADAHTKLNKTQSICLDTSSTEAAEWVCKWAPICGFSVTGWSINKEATNFGPRTNPLNRISLQEGHVEYTVVSIEEAYTDDVFCATVPGLNEFLLPGGIVTGNCAFVSTKELSTDFPAPFVFLMDMSMLGVGVGGDTKGAGLVTIRPPKVTDAEWVIPDSREGWVESVKILLDAFIGKGSVPIFNYSKIRQEGERIRGFGGTASGPGPLMELHVNIANVLSGYPVSISNTYDDNGNFSSEAFGHDVGYNDKGHLSVLSFGNFEFDAHEITSTQIVDIFNYIGKCVVAGNVRRTAEIMFGDPNDDDFISLKADPEALGDRRWASNNSIYAEVGMNYDHIAELIANNGEPGLMWLDNARRYSRMSDPEDWKDRRAEGANPCVEQTLESFELCCLVETFPYKHDGLEDYLETLKYAYLYAKTVTLLPTHDQRTNAVMMRNRRIGCSQSGIQNNIARRGFREHMDWSKSGYDRIKNLDKKYSDWLCVPRSIKSTSIKPSGTVSLLPGASPGVHFEHSKYYLRRIRIQKGSYLVDACKNAGYDVDPCPYQPGSMVVSFPVCVENFTKSKFDVSMWEQLELVAQMQAYWADNQVSATITFSKEEAKDIGKAIEMYETRLKSISFLPLSDHGYKLPPYESITEKEFEDYSSRLLPLDLSQTGHEVEDKFCDGDKCVLPI